MIPVIQLLGGEGKRLKEITNGKIPKPLIKINNNSILEIQIKHLISFGFKDFIIFPVFLPFTLNYFKIISF